MKHRKIFLFILAIGILLRAIFLVTSLEYLEIGSDEAVLGLMAKHVWLGEFPLMTWAQSHGGTLETYLNAPLYLLFGLRPIMVRLLPLLFSITYLILCYLLVNQVFGRNPALISMSITAIPPVYLCILASLGVSMNGPALIGVISGMYITHKIIAGNKNLGLCLLLGFIWGITFWVHQIVIFGIVTGGFFLFLNDIKLFFKKYFWAIISGFIIGSLPLWLYNIKNDFDTFRVAGVADIATTINNLKTAVTFTLPTAWGLKLPTYIDNPYFIDIPKTFFWLLAGIYTGLLIISIFLKPEKRQRFGKLSLWFLFFIILFITSRNRRTNWWSTRYLIHTYTALIPLIGLGLSWIYNKQKLVFTLILSTILAVNLYGNIKLLSYWKDPLFPGEHIDLPGNKDLIKFLKKEGIKYGYMHYWLSYPVVFNTDEGIILSPAYDERFGKYKQPYLEKVSKAKDVAYIFHKHTGTFQAALEKAGIEYKKKGLYPFTIFYRFRFKEADLEEIPTAKWSVTSNYNNQQADLAIDRNNKTRWGTAHPQTKGMYFQIDMGEEYKIGKIIIYLGDYSHDFPRGLDIYISPDAMHWTKVYENPEVGGSVFWSNGQPRFFIQQEEFSCIIEPTKARYIKLVQTGTHPRLDWSIVELNLMSTS